MAESFSVELTSPAKINLDLAVLGRRADGFHAIDSVVAQTEWGDSVGIDYCSDGDPQTDTVRFVGHGVDRIDAGQNTVRHALRLFREASGLCGGRFAISITKRIPSGAGFGGGSSNAATLLRGLAQCLPGAVSRIDAAALLAAVGSDCPLFLTAGPAFMRGRGECIEPVASASAAALHGLRVVLFQPGFAMDTATAYRRMADLSAYSTPDEIAHSRAAWLAGKAALPGGHNDFERLLPTWYPSLAVVLQELRQCGLDARLSGSGSGAFVVAKAAALDVEHLVPVLRDAWGSDFWIQSSRLK